MLNDRQFYRLLQAAWLMIGIAIVVLLARLVRAWEIAGSG